MCRPKFYLIYKIHSQNLTGVVVCEECTSCNYEGQEKNRRNIIPDENRYTLSIWWGNGACGFHTKVDSIFLT